MNVKPGDLAVIVSSSSPDFTANLGRIVRVQKFYGPATFVSGHESDYCWLVEGRLVTRSGAPFCRFSRKLGFDACVPHEWLRPIRPHPDNAIDEVIQRIGTPHKETA